MLLVAAFLVVASLVTAQDAPPLAPVEHKLPSGRELELRTGWKSSNVFSGGEALLYWDRDSSFNHKLMIFPPGEAAPTCLYQTNYRNSAKHGPGGSLVDGTLYIWLDVNRQMLAVDTRTWKFAVCSPLEKGTVSYKNEFSMVPRPREGGRGMVVSSDQTAYFMANSVADRDEGSKFTGMYALDIGQCALSELFAMDGVYSCWDVSLKRGSALYLRRTLNALELVEQQLRGGSESVLDLGLRFGGRLELSPDENTLLVVGSHAGGSDVDQSRLYAVDLKGRSLFQLTENGYAGTWSPDGRWIAYLDRHEVWLMDYDARIARKLASQSSHTDEYAIFGYDNPPAWSSDGRFLSAGIGGYKCETNGLAPKNYNSTVILDLSERLYVVLPCSAVDMLWVPWSEDLVTILKDALQD